MNIEKVLLSELRAAEKNTRIHNQKQIDEFVRSLKMFGQIRPAVIDENNVVWCGNGMIEAARQSGWTEVECFRKAGMTEDQKKKLMLADNQIFSLGAINKGAIDEIMTELQDFDVPGFDEETLEQIYGDIESATEEIQNYGSIDQETVQQINRVEASRSESDETQVFTQDHVQAIQETPYATSGEAQQTHVDLPPTIEAVNGMLNVPSSKNDRPFILCPRCGEKIYV